jgi:hypothetical protein
LHSPHRKTLQPANQIAASDVLHLDLAHKQEFPRWAMRSAASGYSKPVPFLNRGLINRVPDDGLSLRFGIPAYKHRDPSVGLER